MEQKIPVDSLSSLDEYVEQSPSLDLLAHMDHETTQAQPSIVQYEPPPLVNAKAPFYHNQKETPAHRAMLHLAAKGYTVKEIAERLDRTPVCVNNILRQPMLQSALVNEIKRVQGEDEMVVEVIKENVVNAVKTLAMIVKDPQAKGSDRIAAANALLERRYGKANQPINRGTDVDLSSLSDSDLAAMLPSTSSTA